MNSNIVVDQRIVHKLGQKTAMVLWKLHAGGFYSSNFLEVNDELCEELSLSMFQFRKVRDFCKVLHLVDVTREGKPNRTKISLNLERYNEILVSPETDFGMKP